MFLRCHCRKAIKLSRAHLWCTLYSIVANCFNDLGPWGSTTIKPKIQQHYSITSVQSGTPGFFPIFTPPPSTFSHGQDLT